MISEKIFETAIANRPLKIKFSSLGEQANSAVLVQYGETTVFVTATMGKTEKPELGFFPLTVEYEERFYAAGKIIGSRFIRRESRPSEAAILAARLIDRSIRPLFHPHLRREVQVVTTVLSIDNENDPDFPALIGASLALGVSDIPWDGPIGGVRIGKIDNTFIINPSYQEREKSEFDLFVSGQDEKISMLEIGAKETSEKELLQAIKIAQEEIKKLTRFQKEIIKEVGQPKIKITPIEDSQELSEKIKNFLKDRLEEAVYTSEKSTRISKITLLKEELLKWLAEQGIEENKLNLAVSLFEEEINELVHKNILEKEKRPDGRKLDEIRPITCQIGFLPRVHGSGLFIRGSTQALSIVTLAAPSRELTIETIEISGSKRFLHHYNFPPYSVGEIGSYRGPGRREIGHGALAEKALLPVIPEKENFPYTIRVVSEILSSNGSSSMASVCGSSLALMDAGVPIKRAVAGIALGLMMKDEKNYKILVDIQGPEDHHGDMDFKIAGTKNGITAVQMDVKVEGLTLEILEKVFETGRRAYSQILEKMNQVISQPRPQISPYAPKIYYLKIDPTKIGEVIGAGGRTINEIINQTGVEIDIEEDGTIYVSGSTEETVKQATALIKSITHEYKVGEIVEGKVSKILDFGALIDLGFGKQALLHISELAPYRVKKVEDVIKLGEVLKLKIIRVEEDGKIYLSLKSLKNSFKNNNKNFLPR